MIFGSVEDLRANMSKCSVSFAITYEIFSDVSVIKFAQETRVSMLIPLLIHTLLCTVIVIWQSGALLENCSDKPEVQDSKPLF